MCHDVALSGAGQPKQTSEREICGEPYSVPAFLHGAVRLASTTLVVCTLMLNYIVLKYYKYGLIINFVHLGFNLSTRGNPIPASFARINRNLSNRIRYKRSD